MAKSTRTIQWITGRAGKKWDGVSGPGAMNAIPLASLDDPWLSGALGTTASGTRSRTGGGTAVDRTASGGTRDRTASGGTRDRTATGGESIIDLVLSATGTRGGTSTTGRQSGTITSGGTRTSTTSTGGGMPSAGGTAQSVREGEVTQYHTATGTSGAKRGAFRVGRTTYNVRQMTDAEKLKLAAMAATSAKPIDMSKMMYTVEGSGIAVEAGSPERAAEILANSAATNGSVASKLANAQGGGIIATVSEFATRKLFGVVPYWLIGGAGLAGGAYFLMRRRGQ